MSTLVPNIPIPFLWANMNVLAYCQLHNEVLVFCPKDGSVVCAGCACGRRGSAVCVRARVRACVVRHP